MSTVVLLLDSTLLREYDKQDKGLVAVVIAVLV